MLRANLCYNRDRARQFNTLQANTLPGVLGIVWEAAEPGRAEGRLVVETRHMAPNGFLHADTVIALVDTACGLGCMSSLPDGASGFTTIELKSNFLGTARDGSILCRATPAHLGRNTQVWDAVITKEADGKVIALFRCTQMVLWQNPKP